MIKEETARAQPKASTCEWRQQKYTGTYDAQDRLLSYGPFDFTYTANGELETKTNRDTGEAWLFQYDALGSLLTVGLPNGDLVEYLVDGLGRRVGKKKNGVLLKQWIYRDVLKPVAELDGSGSLVTEFVYGSKSNVPDYVRRGGATYRVISDHLGSPRHVVNVANSSDVPFTASYSSFGEVTGTGLDWMPFGFAGGTHDGDSPIVRFGARDYDPSLGRWISKDPIGFVGGANLYAYGRLDPVNTLDSTGRLDVPVCNTCILDARDAQERCKKTCLENHITDAPICSTPGEPDNAYHKCIRECEDAAEAAKRACLDSPACTR